MLRYNTEGLSSFLKESDYASVAADIAAASRTLREGSGRGNDFIGWRDLPETYDREEYARIKAAAKRIRETSDILIVIGIGGSYLGARAVTELLLGELHNEVSKPRIYFAGCSLSPDDLDDLLRICDTGEVSVNVISKSGTTTEPAVAFRLFKAYLEKRYGAEEAARRVKAEAAAAARNALAEAKAAAQATIEEAEKKAQEELRELVRKADEKATADARELALNTENKKAAMRVKAESRLDQAAGLVVERIVGS